MRELEADPGLQLQRTALAWQRTALAAAGAALVTALAWARLGSVEATVLALALSAVPAAVGRRRGRARTEHGRMARALLALVAVVAVLGLLGAGAAFIGAAT